MRALAIHTAGSSRSPWRATAVVGAALAVACAHTQARAGRDPAYETAAESPQPQPRQEVQVGFASWYGAALAGRSTASGEKFDPSKMTAAHRSLPFGTWVEVTRVDTGQTVRVRITDRGPFGHAERIIDLSRAAAKELDMLKLGSTRVKVTVLAVQ
jgi:rare lipoprotein A